MRRPTRAIAWPPFARSVSEGVEDHVDRELVSLRRKRHEEPWILRFTFHRIADVGVVCHDDHDASAAIGDRPKVGVRTVGAALGRTAAACAPEVDAWYLGRLSDLEQRFADRM